MLAYLRGEIVEPYPVVWVDRQGNMTPLWEERGLYGVPRLSPDGTRLAMNVWRDNNMDVWVYDLQRGGSTRLTFDEGRDDDHIWSPDSQYLAFSSTAGNQSANIYQVRADGSGEVERLTTGDGEHVPMAWSPDGKFIAYENYGPQGNADIWVLPLGGNQEPQLFANADAYEGHADFSPNGRWIAYVSSESGTAEIYVRSYPPGPGKWQGSDNGGVQPRWSADGRELFFRTNDGIMVVAVETEGDSFGRGVPKQLFEGNFLGGMAGVVVGGETYMDYDVSADGQQFVMFPDAGQSTQTGMVTLVINWFDELKQLVPTDP